VIEYYGDSSMPMQLTMLGEQVYGHGPGGQSGAARQVQMMAGGEIHSGLLI
jgi:splicing suppressor protein 51